MMKVTETVLPGCLLIEPKLFIDERGFFCESFNQRAFNHATGLNFNFVQDNHSKSIKGVLRGLHYQLPPNAQGKLVRALHGAVLDVAVDIRKSSPTYGQWLAVELTAGSHKQFWMPPGIAHGFLVLSDAAEILYKTTTYYSATDERCIAWDDPEINIDWPLIGQEPLISAKDRRGVSLAHANVFD
jgi:dTDP-4-dehydrorhamnose 3,5-epimerase